ncbi:hypothetical protein HYW21_03085 [Candidatus Woesearchaeota archaeon]|nr:hypothetical protein [Candidatus Woesearchaeota archaeon]
MGTASPEYNGHLSYDRDDAGRPHLSIGVPAGLVSYLCERLPQPGVLHVGPRDDQPTLDFTVLDDYFGHDGTLSRPLTVSQGGTMVSIEGRNGLYTHPGVAVNYDDGSMVECVDISPNAKSIYCGFTDIKVPTGDTVEDQVRLFYVPGKEFFDVVLSVPRGERTHLLGISGIVARLISENLSPSYVHSRQPLDDALVQLGYGRPSPQRPDVW